MHHGIVNIALSPNVEIFEYDLGSVSNRESENFLPTFHKWQSMLWPLVTT